MTRLRRSTGCSHSDGPAPLHGLTILLRRRRVRRSDSTPSWRSWLWFIRAGASSEGHGVASLCVSAWMMLPLSLCVATYAVARTWRLL